MDARRGVEVKPPRKDVELKRLAKFYAVDRPPRKRLRTLLEFLRSPSGGADGNLVGTVQQLLVGAHKETGSAADNSALLSEFWSDAGNCGMLFDVLSDCVAELEMFIPLIHEGWKSHGFTLLFSKLLKRDNHALIKKYAFRESVDFSPYGGGSIQLPDKFVNQGVHVEGWIRSTPTQAEEPVDMLKFIMDLSLEREDAKVLTNPKVNHKARGDRFEFWTELIMRFYMPLLCQSH
ncbi:hypothetical protein P43SY_008679 [Pythium insidiosum]|uniref:Uncharacterized protein n=1 Tax=Pythium insidiosum TaxID=114742 RepID=A0AAD5LHY5_PYTIN|nr:hypothetical protein P43SY_008679 [Pythium insidiosum]